MHLKKKRGARSEKYAELFSQPTPKDVCKEINLSSGGSRIKGKKEATQLDPLLVDKVKKDQMGSQ